MKTRSELILDFMLALSANSTMTPPELEPFAIAQMIRTQAENLTNEVLENL
jgi:hypothetical protein